MVSESLITKETSLPDFRLWKYWLKKSIRLDETIHVDQLILVDPVEDEDVEDSSTDWSSNFDNARSKEKKDYHSSDRYCFIWSSLSYLHLLAW